MEHTIVGYYNEMQYRVALDGNEIYRAGNSPYESQTYVRKEDGVGRRTMRSYCISTSRELAKERNAKYNGVEYEELEDD